MDIQKLVNETSGNLCLLPEGRFVINDTIRFPKANFELRGAGIGKTILEVDPNAEPFKNGNNLMIEVDRKNGAVLAELTLDGKKDERTSRINTGWSHAVSFAWLEDFGVYNVEVINSAGASIVMYNTKNGELLDNLISNSGSNGILGMQEMVNINVLRNKVKGTQHQNGIFFMYQGGKSSKHIIIDENEVYNSADYGIEVGHTTHMPNDPPHQDIWVRKNKIYRCVGSGIGFRTVSEAQISDNYIEDYAKSHDYGCNGVFVEGRVSLCYNVDVLRNEIRQSYPLVQNQPHPYQQAMYLTGMDGMNVKENKIYGSHNQAIYVLASWGDKSPDFPDGRRKYANMHVDNNFVDNDAPIVFDPYPSEGNTALNNEARLIVKDADVRTEGNSEPIEPNEPEDPPVIEPTPEPQPEPEKPALNDEEIYALVMYRASQMDVHLKAHEVEEVIQQYLKIIEEG